MGFALIFRTHWNRPIMGRELCHVKEKEIQSGIQVRSGGDDRGQGKVGGVSVDRASELGQERPLEHDV